MSESVKVIARCRPLNEKEREVNTPVVIDTDPKLQQCSLRRPGDDSKITKTYTFDGVYGIACNTEKIYSEIVRPIVNGVLEGYNGTVFAYGQTSCGKTFTMEGVRSPLSQKGIIPRCCEHILSSIQQSGSNGHAKYLLRVSYLEIYNEEIRDLLVKDYRYKPEIKEHPDKGIYVKGLSNITVDSCADMEDILEAGGKNRSVGATFLNADSSRSHSIFTVDLEACVRMHTEQGDDEVFRTGKLNLVDLAGSERQSKSGCTGERFKEATKINLSLSVLGNVISALGDGKSKHIPYRDSKLTRLLQDSLGGNSKTLMVACISPGANNYEETLSTLRYAKRAKNIKNKPKINEDPKDMMIRKYQDELKQLKKIIAKEIPVPRQLARELREMSEESTTRSLSFSQTVTRQYEKLETGHKSQLRIQEYQTKLVETQQLHVQACQETTTLKRELDELKTQLSVQQRRLEYETRKSMLEEHKTALMLLRGRRTADGGSSSISRVSPRVSDAEIQCSSSDSSPDVSSSEDTSPEVTSKGLAQQQVMMPSDILESQILKNTAAKVTSSPEVTSLPEMASSGEVTSLPEVPHMVSVATSTGDLRLLDSSDDEVPEDWNIQENMLCREEAEGRSRSTSPYTAEKKRYAEKEMAESAAVDSLDEEGPVSSGLCCLCPEMSFFGEKFHFYQQRRLEEFLRKQKH